MVKKIVFFFVAAIVFGGAVASAQDPCPCVPLAPVWIPTPCETWNCAQAAMIMANGDPYVMAVPTRSTKFKWVVLRRVVSGSAAISPDNPFQVESFSGASDGAQNYASIASDHMPVMVTATDGKTLVVHLKEAELPPDSVSVAMGAQTGQR